MIKFRILALGMVRPTVLPFLTLVALVCTAIWMGSITFAKAPSPTGAIESNVAAQANQQRVTQPSQPQQYTANVPEVDGCWRVIHSLNSGPADSFLYGMVAISSSDVWAVGSGSDANSGARALTEHWDGSTWSIVPSPNVGTGDNFLNGVVAISSSDVWAVGVRSDFINGVLQTLTEHWDGSVWSIVPSPNTENGGGLSAVAAISSSDVWAVGSSPYDSTNLVLTLIEHWDGSAWSIVPSPNVGTAGNALNGVAAISSSDVWAVGDYYDSTNLVLTLIEHWDGSAWSIVPSPNVGTAGNALNGIAAISSSDVWAVGSAGQQTLIEHWDGSAWSIVPSPNTENGGRLSAVAAISSSDVWAVGSDYAQQTLTEHWDGSAWSIVPSPNVGTAGNFLNGVVAISSSDVWAVGDYYDFSTQVQTLTERYSNEPCSTATLSITSVDLEQPECCDANPIWTPISTDGTTDGNVVRIEATILNSGATSQTVKVWFEDEENGQILPCLTQACSGFTQITVPAGQAISGFYSWNSDGFAWGPDQRPLSNRTIRVVLTDLNSQELGRLTQNVLVKPKPVILVHGWDTDAQATWGLYTGYFTAYNPDWQAFPVTGMNTKDTPTNTVYTNAYIMGNFIENVRHSQTAWHVDIVAHSMGGLISRKYIQSYMPDIPTIAGIGPMVGHLVMLGTPNLGTPCADLIAHSPFFPQPATYQLTTDWVFNDFNPVVNDSKGVYFSALAGNPVPDICGVPLPGDLLVPELSATAYSTDTVTNNSVHTNCLLNICLPNGIPYLTSHQNFIDFVMPRLAISCSLARTEIKKGEDQPNAITSPTIPMGGPTSPQIILTDTRQIPGGTTVDVPITVSTSTAFGVALPGQPSVEPALLDPFGNLVDSIGPQDPRLAQPIQTLSATNPVTGTWTLRITNSGGGPVTEVTTSWIDGSPVTVTLDISQSDVGGDTVLTSTLTNLGQPITGASVVAVLSAASNATVQVTLIDGAGSGNYVGTASLPTHEIYGVVVSANISGTTRITTGVADNSVSMPSPTSTLTPSSTAITTPTATVFMSTGTPTATPTSCSLTFNDVAEGSTFYPFIHCLACRGIVNGYSDGTFRPNNPVTRGQLAKTVSNSAGFSETHTEQAFQDVPVGSTFYNFIARLASRGIIAGYTCGAPAEPCVPPSNLPYFRPNANVTRGQTSKIVAIAKGLPGPPSGQQTFQDVTEGSTFWSWIESLAGIGAISGYQCGGNGEPCVPPQSRPYFRPNANVTRGQSAKIVSNTFFPNCVTPTQSTR